MLSKIIPEGFKDDVTALVISEHHFKNKIIQNFLLNGFQLVKTPLLEFFNKDMSQNVFKTEIKKNEIKLNIRDDITLQIARLSETRLSKKNKPIKLCYYGEVVRKNGTMLRPERQFLQIGAECIGEKNFLADVEIMELAYTSLAIVGINDITIEISSRIFFDKFYNKIKKLKYKDQIKRLFKLKDMQGILNIVDNKYHKYIEDIFSCTGIYNEKKLFLNNLDIDKDTSEEILNIKNIVNKFLVKNKKVNIFLDLCEIDNQNYHSGVRFTFFSNNARGEIARGGRYFLENSSKNNFATGFTCYMDSILRASSVNLIEKKIYVPFDANKKIVKKLISKDFILVRCISDLKITKKLAKNQDCQYYLINNTIKKVR
jgi:ATP phosphoribosyltransferase regulatory subunit